MPFLTRLRRLVDGQLLAAIIGFDATGLAIGTGHKCIHRWALLLLVGFLAALPPIV